LGRTGRKAVVSAGVEKAAVKAAGVDPKVRTAFEGLLGSCSRAAMDLFDHDCTCVFHGHVKQIAKDVKALMDLQKIAQKGGS